MFFTPFSKRMLLLIFFSQLAHVIFGESVKILVISSALTVKIVHAATKSVANFFSFIV